MFIAVSLRDAEVGGRLEHTAVNHPISQSSSSVDKPPVCRLTCSMLSAAKPLAQIHLATEHLLYCYRSSHQRVSEDLIDFSLSQPVLRLLNAGE